MREYLIRLLNEEGFVPVTLLLQGGHTVEILSPEFIGFEVGVLYATIHVKAGHRYCVDVDKIVAVRSSRPVQ